jgi:YjbE family integral membrane protein
VDAPSFLSALLAIVVIDLVLAGDNAIVIALAARGLPVHLQKRAIVWGAAGAVAVRSLMTVIVVWLLKVPGLLLAGGLLLVWIAYRLLLPGAEDDAEARTPTATTFWGAMRTIVIADAVMGLDNVLAVAGAAHGSYLLVVVGLLISVPIVVWGSTVVLRVVNRFPAVVYLGAAVLAWTAARMMAAEPLLRRWFEGEPLLHVLPYLAIPLVLWAGFVRNHRVLESRIHARLAKFALQRPAADRAEPVPTSATAASTEGDLAMLKVLVPVDGSPNALGAVRHAIEEYRRQHDLELHLLNVQPRLHRHISRFVSRQDRESWHHERAEAAMAGARALLVQADVPHQSHRAAGDRAREICKAAARLGVHRIVMGTARKNSITRMLEDSVTHKVLESTPVPVEIVAGEAVSRWERWGVPAGVVGAGGLLLLGLD